MARKITDNRTPWSPGCIVLDLANLSSVPAMTVVQANQTYRRAQNAARVADEAILRVIHGLVS